MWEFLWGLLSIIVINIVVSGDNAMVIALASKRLQEDERKKAIFWGMFGAVAIRVVLTFVAVYLMKVPLLQAVGALFLLWVAFKLLVDNTDEELHVKESTNYGQAIRTIVIADLILSIDNIFAVAGAGRESNLLIFLGLAISIPIIIWSSTLILKLLTRFPFLIYVGAGVLGWTAGSMMMHDHLIDPLIRSKAPDFIVPIVTTLLVCGLGKWYSDRRTKQHLAENV
ncbi:MAG TPA: TerC family protein [Bacilli bacterium]|nr:TerC family protein [Bacilli bacterium]